LTISETTFSSGAGAASAATAANGAGSEQRFLKLLVTQLNNQDPLNPLDNAELTSQLAQMSTVSGIEKLNATLDSLVAQSGASQVLQSASLIGRSVLVPGSTVNVAEGGATSFAIETAGAAESVTVTVTNAAGETVRTMELGALPAGVKTLSWDGKANDGSTVADGSYTLGVKASSADAKVPAIALTYAAVASVAQNTGGISLDLGAGRSASLSAVRLIL
jgi:flagellar basal-body rod modification protein FlgD